MFVVFAQLIDNFEKIKGENMKKSLYSLLLFVSIASGDFIRDDSKEVVLDASTNLLWQDNNDSKTLTKTWNEAITYCEGLELGGYSDWRLPNLNELYSLLDSSKYNPALSSVFANVVSYYDYWSSTSRAGNSYSAWTVTFSNGSVFYYNPKTTSYYVRCVRAGQ